MALNPKITDWHGCTVWLIGASSGIGRATASALHARGARVVVSARNTEALDEFVAAHGEDPARGHVAALAVPIDVSNPADFRAAAGALLARMPVHRVVYCAGHYGEMRASEFNLAEILRHEQVNYVGALYVLDRVLPHLLARAGDAGAQGASRGHISLVSSVAGYGGLPKSLAYGPTKAALINLAEVLYLDLRASGIGVSLISPGFVRTPLTAGNEFSMPALQTPEQAAAQIVSGWERGEFEIHFPKRFTRSMKLLRLLPYTLYFSIVRRFTGL